VIGIAVMHYLNEGQPAGLNMFIPIGDAVDFLSLEQSDSGGAGRKRLVKNLLTPFCQLVPMRKVTILALGFCLGSRAGSPLISAKVGAPGTNVEMPFLMRHSREATANCPAMPRSRPVSRPLPPKELWMFAARSPSFKMPLCAT